MTTYLSPVPIGYTKLLLPKSIGGNIQFLKSGTLKVVRFIDTFDLNLSMFVLLSKTIFLANVANTLFSLDLTYADGTIQSLWSYKIQDDYVGFTLPRRYYDLGDYKSITGLYLNVSHEITQNNHDFIMWSGAIKLIEYVSNTFIGGEIEISNLAPNGLRLSWYKSNYDYVNISWEDGLTTGQSSALTFAAGSVQIVSVTKNSLVITRGSGNYDSVIIIYNNQILASYLTSSQYPIFNLLPNTTYTYSVVPYANLGIIGSPTIISSVTYALIDTINVTPITDTQIQVSWTGSNYSEVIVSWALDSNPSVTINNSTPTALNTTSYIVQNLSSNIKYNFKVFPINSAKVINNIDYLNQSATTFAVIGAISIDNATITTNSLVLAWNQGTATQVNIIWAQTSQILNYALSSTPITGLLENTIYTFGISPINSNGDIYKTVYSRQVATLATVTNLNAQQITPTSFTIFWSGGSYTNINIRLSDNTTLNNIAGYQYPFINLAENTTYQATIYANNSQGLTNTSNYLSIPITTLATITSATISDYTETTVTISWISHSETAVNIYFTQENTLGALIVANATNNQYQVTGLLPNVFYSFRIIPVNSLYAENTNAVYNLYTTTRATLRGNLSVQNVATFSVAINIDSSSIYSYVIVTWENGGKSDKIIGNVATISGLASNILYHFTVTPYNSLDVPNNLVAQTIPITTYATVGAISVTNYTINTIAVAWLPGTYSSLNILLQSPNNPNQNFIVASVISTYTFNVAPNILYTITITPINSVNARNNIGNQQTSVVTYALLSAAIPSVTYTSFTTQWSTSPYTYIIAKCTDTNGTLVATNTIQSQSGLLSTTFSSLSGNTKYTIKLTAYNSANIYDPSAIQSFTLYTYGNVGALSITPIDSKSIYLSWNGGIYNYVNIAWSSGTINRYFVQSNQITISSLNENSTYSFIVTPYNSDTPPAANIPGQRIKPYVTLATAGIPVINSYDSTSVNLSWPIGSSTYVNVVFPGYPNINTNGNIYTSSTYIQGLTPNTIYNIQLIAYNSARVPNTNQLTQLIAPLNTLAILTTAPTISARTPSSLTISWNIDNYYAIGIFTINNILIQTTRNTSYQISGLNSNTAYSYYVIPLNANSVANTSYQYTISDITLATVGVATILSTTSTTAVVQWGYGTYTYVTVSYATDYFTGSQTTVTSLLPNQTYTFAVTAYNSAIPALSNPSPSITTGVTLGTITSATVTTIGITTITISWISTASSQMNITWYGRTTGYQYGIPTSNGSYTITSLISNGAYTFTVTPVNSAGIANNNLADGGTIITSQATTLATVGVPYLLNNGYASASLFISWGFGSYTSLNIDWGTSSITGITTPTYQIQGLTPNTKYTVTLTPVNSINNYNSSTAISFSDYTLATIIGVSIALITTNSIQITWTGGIYDHVSISWGSLPAISTNNMTYTITNLAENTLYNIVVAPVNINGMLNTVEYNSINVITYATVKNVNITNITDTSFRVFWNSGSYSSIRINVYLAANNMLITSQNSTATYYDFTSGLYANTSYIVTVTPLNSGNLPITYNSLISYTLSVTTLATVSSASITAYDSTTATVSFGPNTYSSILVSATRISDGLLTLPPTSTVNNSYYIQNLLPNTAYRISSVPVNSVGASNIASLVSANITELGIIGPATIASNLPTQVLLSWGAGQYASVNINVYNQNNTSIYSTTGITGTIYTLSNNLMPNTSYYANIIPINTAGMSNIAGEDTISFTTLATIDNLTYNPSSNAISIAWTKNNKYTSLSSITTSTLNNNFVNSQIIPSSSQAATLYISGLSPNTSYVNKITPINSSNSYTNDVIINTPFVTLPTLSNLTFPNISTNSATLLWSGAFANTTINWGNNSNANSGTSSTLTATGLQPNTNYTFTATPSNSARMTGQSVSSNIYTAASIGQLYVSSLSNTSVVVGWSNGYFASLNTTIISGSAPQFSYSLSSTSATLRGLNENSSYNFSFTPINIANYKNTLSTQTLLVYTLATVATASVVPNTTYATVLWSGGTYSSINISVNSAIPIIHNGVFGTSYTFPIATLLENTSYNFTIIPVNSISIPGSLYQLVIPSVTLATVGGPTIITLTDTTVTVGWSSGSYSYINITATATATSTIIATLLNISGTQQIVNGLTANKTYTFTIIAVNSAGAPNPPGVNISTATLATFTSTTTITGFDTTSVTFNFGSGTYTSIGISVNGVNIATGITTSTYTTYGLITNTAYIFVISAYNSANAKNPAVDQTMTQITTLATVGIIAITNNTSGSFTINWGTGSYTTLKVNVVNTTTSATIINQTGITQATASIDLFNNITSNTTYNITLTPYNSANVPVAGPLQTLSYTTYATVGRATAVNYSNYILVSWIGGTYTSVVITWVNSAGASGTPVTVTGASSQAFTNLRSQTTYTFTVIPVNKVGVQSIADSVSTSPVTTP
jgi:hypothetical protein